MMCEWGGVKSKFKIDDMVTLTGDALHSHKIARHEPIRIVRCDIVMVPYPVIGYTLADGAEYREYELQKV